MGCFLFVKKLILSCGSYEKDLLSKRIALVKKGELCLKNRLLGKILVITIWIAISVILYQSSKIDQGIKEQELRQEKAKEEIQLTVTKEGQQEKEKRERKQIPQGQIRVLIKTSEFIDIYHKEIVISSKTGLYIEQNKEIKTYAPDEQLILSESELQEEKLIIQSCDNGRITLHNVERAENVDYNGNMECYRTSKGLVLINELPVEEYLYGVVPSEMPSSYPVEALKAQAISARTYTYFHMKDFAYPEWKAHVDDSTSFQVYKNIAEKENVNQAIDDTRNLVLLNQGELIESFYYSTSSGRSSGYEVWNQEKEKAWLQCKALLIEPLDKGRLDDFSYDRKTDYETVKLKERAYRAYMTQGNINDVEYGEPWYRWNYNKSFEDVQVFLTRIGALKEKYPKEIQIISKYKRNEKLTHESQIVSCRITQRAVSGMVQQLCIQTQNFEIYINTQQCIREVLAVQGDTIVRKDGSNFTLGELLPSAYFCIDAMYDHQSLRSMTIYGGGFGHGAGMSQNGAKCLADLGKSAEKILKYYYTDIEVQEVALTNGT